MILTGKEIKKRIGSDIVIDPYSEDRLNPNSYNLRLYNELLQYTHLPLDMKKPNDAEKLVISESGLELKPGVLYLGRTVEYTETHNLVPMLEGRSSIGRLGMYVHVTAGFGDVGFKGFWTLEISVIQPLIIYPNVEICQIFYHTVEGEITEYKSGKYQGNKGIQTSMLYKDFENGKY
ncbi:dCTP deaminase [Leptospira fainei serovar Hurstbridge str. BUT 6]|uniref:dCTP deaminase, dUMP-forming n=1 Tax=Leptospira fainei serovar Hurstbridge str. BUT 6 TaxID=1193011 RepID=S3UZ11_9LEPT|nr:dCTP deaminase [Leptospira fainei]EPG74458.1 dCTP deaminase [Leptospira fainei serovar Hurstbridge str. BUT 6]